MYANVSTCPGDRATVRLFKLGNGVISIVPMLVCIDVYANVSTGPGDRAIGRQFKLRNGVISIVPMLCVEMCIYMSLLVLATR